MSFSIVNKTTAQKVLEVLPFDGSVGLSYQQVHAKVGQWAVITIKGALRQLVDDGLVLKQGTHQYPTFVRKVSGWST